MNRLVITAAIVATASLAMLSPAQAAVTQYWDGGGADNSFNTPANWYNLDPAFDNLVPVSGDSGYVDNGGTVLVNQDNTLRKFYLGVADGSSGYAQVTAGTMNLEYGTYVAYGLNSRAELQMSGGTINATEVLLMGNATGAVGIVRQTGGSITINPNYNTGWSRIANTTAGGGYGWYDMSGGELHMSGFIVGNSGSDSAPGVGIFTQSAGTYTADSTLANFTDPPGLRFGTNRSALGTYNLSGGTCTVGNLYAGGSASSGGVYPEGQINISGTGRLTVYHDAGGVNTGIVRLGYSNGTLLSVGAVNVATGGVFAAPMLRSGSGVDASTAGWGLLNFHGGTLVTNADQADYLQYMDAYVYDTDARIDTDGHNVTFNRAILKATDYGVASVQLDTFSPGQGYQGPPAVKLTGGSGHGATGIATVAGGVITGVTITNPGSGYLAGETLVAEFWGGGATVPANNGTVTLAPNVATGGLQKVGLGTLTLAGVNTYTGATSVQAGGLAVTGSITSDVTVAATASLSGTGTITGDVDLNGTLAVRYDMDADTIDRLTISESLDLTGGIISLSGVGSGTLANGDYVFAVYGSRVGTAASVTGLQAGWSLDYAFDYDGGVDNSIALHVQGIQITVPGDTDGDNDVDAADAATLAGRWGQDVGNSGPAAGDFNADGWVNAADASILAANWTGSMEGAAVPEPGTIVLLLGAAAVLAVARRRK